MVCKVILCFVTLLTLQRTKLRYRLQKARGEAGKRSAQACGWKPEGPRPTPCAWAWFTTAISDQGHAQNNGLSARSLIKGPRPEAHGVVFGYYSEINSWECDDMPSYCRRHVRGLNNHYLPARIMSNHVAPG